MGDHYKKLPAGPGEASDHNKLLQLVTKKWLGITVREYGIFGISIVLATLANFMVRSWLYQMSIDYVLELQRVGRDPYIYEFFSTVTLIGSSEFIYGTLLLIYIFCSRALAVHYTFVISSMFFWLCFMKTIVMYPRPF